MQFVCDNLKMMNYKQPMDPSPNIPTNLYPDLQPQYYPPTTRLPSQQHISYPPSHQTKMYEFRNFIGMMLQELRYSCQILKQQFWNDKTYILQNFKQTSYALKELSDKLNETEQSKEKTNHSTEEFLQLIQENQLLNRQVERLKRVNSQNMKEWKEEVNKIQQESYQTFEENFILNQKIVNLETELESKTTEMVEDLKKEYENSVIGLNNQILGLQQNLREKDETIGILEKLVKDYETMQDRKSMHQDNDNSKVLNMFSMQSHDSKRNQILRNQGYKQSMVRQKQRQKYEIKRQDPKRYSSNHSNQYGEFRSLDTSNYGQLQSPTHANHSQFISSFSNYRQNYNQNPSIHSNSGARLPPPASGHSQFIYQSQASYIPRSDPYYSSGIQYQNNPPSSSVLPPRFAGSRVVPKNELSNFSYSSYVGAGQQMGGVGMRGRQKEDERERGGGERKEMRSQAKRHASRQSRHQQNRENKVDLAKIEQELEGLAKELKSQLASISKKKM